MCGVLGKAFYIINLCNDECDWNYLAYAGSRGMK